MTWMQHSNIMKRDTGHSGINTSDQNPLPKVSGELSHSHFVGILGTDYLLKEHISIRRRFS